MPGIKTDFQCVSDHTIHALGSIVGRWYTFMSLSSDQGVLFLRVSFCLSFQQPAWNVPCSHLRFSRRGLPWGTPRVCRYSVYAIKLGQSKTPWEYQLLSPSVCFCWASADIAIKIHAIHLICNYYLRLDLFESICEAQSLRNVFKTLEIYKQYSNTYTGR